MTIYLFFNVTCNFSAFCKNPIDCQWYEFDDTHVKPISSRDIVSRAAYLLFYQRRQLTNASRSALCDGTHWIYTLYERPNICNAANSEKYVDVPGGRIRAEKSENFTKDQKIMNVTGKSKSAERDHYLDKEHDYRDLHREINSPRQSTEKQADSICALREQINSPRQERSFRSISDKGIRNDRHTSDDLQQSRFVPNEQLRVNLDTSRPSAGQNIAENGLNVSDKYYVEKVKLPNNESSVSDKRLINRSFSQDSYRNAMNNLYTSNLESGLSYNPLSPHEIIKSSPPSPGTPDSAGSREKKTLLNNERTVNIQGGVANDMKLKIHQNELDKQSMMLKGNKIELGERSDNTKNYSQTKMTNKSKSEYGNEQTVRADVFATPQQNRKSPSPPIQNGRGPWLTPQPQRKNVNTSEPRPVMERQSSMPGSKAKPVSPYFEHHLEKHKQPMTDIEPHSLPVAINYTSEKPPLPSRPSTASRVPARQKSQDGFRSAENQKFLENSPGLKAEPDIRGVRDERRGYDNETIRKNISERDLIERARSVERDWGQGNAFYIDVNF